MENENPGGEDFVSVDDKIKNDSFRVKRILLELPNYGYYHSVIGNDDDDINDRFVGRKAIINRIKSFIYETSKNTGAYLVTGFRGMGKTSVVNKAISGLNAKPRFTNYFYLWLALLPLTIYYIHGINIIRSIIESPWRLLISIVSLSLVYTLSAYYFGYKNPAKKGKTAWGKIKIGIISIVNSKFYKHKFRFPRILKNILIYIFIAVFLGFLFYLKEGKEGVIYVKSKHQFFWFVTKAVAIVYFAVDIYKEYIKKSQRIYQKTKDIDKNKGLSKIKTIGITGTIGIILVFSAIALIGITPILTIELGICELLKTFLIHLPLDSEKVHVEFIFQTIIFGLFFFVYVVLKYKFKHASIRDSGEKYRTVLGRVLAFFDFQHYITVKVNLGKDKLTEKDVLKYLTNELLNEYKKWYYNIKSFKRLANISLHCFLLFTLALILNSALFGKEFVSFTLNKMHMAAFFPSQSVIEQDFDLSYIFENQDTSNIDELNKYIKVLEEHSGHSNIKIGYKSLEILQDTSVVESISYRPKGSQNKAIFNAEDSLNLTQDMSPVVTFVGQEQLNILSSKKELQIENQTFLNKTIVTLALVTNEVDFLFLKLWYKARMILLHEWDLSDGNSSKDMFRSFYPKVPPLVVFLLVVFFITMLRFVPTRFIILKTHFITIRQLSKLKRQIDASIEVEKGGAANTPGGTLFNYSNRIRYKPLEAKDITQRLIHILDEVSNLNPIFVNLRFIFIFDELDKISTHFNSSIANIEDEFDVETTEVRYQVRRKERIGRILSSMKHFLNSAKAKFIFIAGREMYDAALAGISDRESSLDSIFNDNKIYVNSFYKENVDRNLADITSITEQYLCQFLIPEYFKNITPGAPSLKMYNQYLVNEVKISLEKRIKIMVTLKDFVVYLTYRCNGAPRKLSNLIEQYIIPVCDRDINEKEADIMRIVVGKNNENPYLKIGYYNQYKFSLISYLISPIFFGIGNYMHEYSDKLLVSISYMLDHLFKHHKFGISYRNLSLTPEIVDINKEPQFREFLDKLIGLLSKSHLRLIVSGIHDYKFNGKIAAEMIFLSKIDEYEAAAFNFTLDESIELKRHFNRRLESLKLNPENVIVNNLNKIEEDYINNVSLLHMMIGDLHFYDEEYHEAIVHYLDAIQVMRQRDYRNMNLYDFVLYVRNKLKLGLAFEKNKMYDNALMTFSELTDLIIRKRNISLRKIGLARFIISRVEFDTFFYNQDNNNAIQNLHFLSEDYNKLEGEISRNSKNEVVVAGRLKTEIVKGFSVSESEEGYEWKKLYGIKDMMTYYGLDDTDLINNKLGDIPTNYKQIKHYFLLSTGESVRLLYQPLISKLHLIEKTSPDKLKDIDIIRSIKEFNFLKAPLNTEAKRVIVAEFYNKIGDLLYFKNGTLNMEIKYSLTDKVIDKNLTGSDEDIKEKTKKAKKLLMSPIDACLFYIKSLSVLFISMPDEMEDKKERTIDFIAFYNLREISNDNISNNLSNFFHIVKEENLNPLLKKIKLIINKHGGYKQRYSSEYLSSIANGITDLADVLLSFVRENTKGANLIQIDNFIYDQLHVDFWEILNLYNSAKEIYASIGENRLARSQMLKVLYVLNNCDVKTLGSLIDESDHFFMLKGGGKLELIIDECISLSRSTYNQSSYVEEQKLKEILEEDSNSTNFDDLKLYTSVLGSEVEEIENLYHLFLLKVSKLSKKRGYKKLVNKFTRFNGRGDLNIKVETYLKKSINPHSIVRRKNNRLIALQLLLYRNEQDFEDNYEKLLASDSTSDETQMVNMEYLILNSIGAGNELIKLHNLFGINYITTNHVDLAKAHRHMGYWCDNYSRYCARIKSDTKASNEFKERIKDYILNSRSLNYLDREYHYNLAIDYNHKLIDFHTRGSTLQLFKKPVSFLDDFYNDNIIHFSIAIERNALLRQASTDAKIEKLKTKLTQQV